MTETLQIDQVRVGAELPPLDVPITAAIVVGGALASRDFTPVHHDRAAAQAQGLPDIFMNILTTNGYVGRYVTDWAGPDAVMNGVSLKLGGPMLPGDTLKLRGEVVAAQNGRVEIQVTGDNSWGNHVTATVKLSLPSTA
jgi:acyl dehydratase